MVSASNGWVNCNVIIFNNPEGAEERCFQFESINLALYSSGVACKLKSDSPSNTNMYAFFEDHAYSKPDFSLNSTNTVSSYFFEMHASAIDKLEDKTREKVVEKIISLFRDVIG